MELKGRDRFSKILVPKILYDSEKLDSLKIVCARLFLNIFQNLIKSKDSNSFIDLTHNAFAERFI